MVSDDAHPRQQGRFPGGPEGAHKHQKEVKIHFVYTHENNTKKRRRRCGGMDSSTDRAVTFQRLNRSLVGHNPTRTDGVRTRCSARLNGRSQALCLTMPCLEWQGTPSSPGMKGILSRPKPGHGVDRFAQHFVLFQECNARRNCLRDVSLAGLISTKICFRPYLRPSHRPYLVCELRQGGGFKSPPITTTAV